MSFARACPRINVIPGAGVAGVAVVRAHSKKLKERNPDAWLGQQLHSIEESCKVLGKVKADLEAVPADDTAAVAAAVERLELVIGRVSLLVRKQLQIVGVAKVPKPWWAPLTRALQLGCEAGVSNPPRSLVMFSFMTNFLQFLPQHCAGFVLKTASSCAANAHGGTTHDSKAFFDAAANLWERILSSKATLPAKIGGYAVDELKPWMPYISFRRALVRLQDDGAVKGGQQTANVEALDAARVALGLLTGVDSAAAPPSGSKRSRTKAKLPTPNIPRPRATTAFRDHDDDASSTTSSYQESVKSADIPVPTRKTRKSAIASYAEPDDIDDEIASQTQPMHFDDASITSDM